MSSVSRKTINFVLLGALSSAVPAYAAPDKVLYRFQGGTDGGNPFAALIDVGGTLYGTTQGGGSGNGTVFAVTKAGAEKAIYSFKGGSDGQSPYAGLINVGGVLYGTTTAGGAGGSGTVFRVTTAGVENVLYSFQGGSDGAAPYGGLAYVRGTFYGTTADGGAGAYGTVYSVTKTGNEKVLYSFKGGSDGTHPMAGLLNVGGTLYGTTYEGGGVGCMENAGCGTVYSVSMAGNESVVYAFKGGSDGNGPNSGLIEVGGLLYGTTTYGGQGACEHSIFSGCGTVFSVSLEGVETVLHTFQNANDGIAPFASLLNVNGTLYGTTAYGTNSACNVGLFGCGTVFSVTTAGSEAVLHFFGRSNGDGVVPYAGLINVGGKLYGTTNEGLTNSGTVFRVTP